ncbi:Outer spore wall RRT8-like protein [Cladobotryum mycophilum]|uniref:Outer spore wall RRT8-like protein n=1 Tax=Cladobotryum mycophilum TaxID=491253 RepID=A0ABR0SRZ4_9HYPO
MAESSKGSSSSTAPNGDKSTRSRVANSVSERAQNVIKEDYDIARNMALDAMKSRAYLYPIKGILYFISHRELWKPFISRLGPYATLSFTVIVGMFIVAYLPQLAVLVFVNGPLAVFTTVLLIFSESSTIISMVSRLWLLQDALLDIFDATLISRNQTGIVREGREVHAGSDSMQKLGKIIKNPFQKFSLTALVRYVMYLPLNVIPVVGTVMFILLQGRNRGKGSHDRYFQLKNWNSSQKAKWVSTHAGSYTSFGIVATLLELIPLASLFFTYTNAVGAALWAADLEEHTSAMSSETAPNLRQKAETADKDQ